METETTPRKRTRDHQVNLSTSALKKAQKIADHVTKGDTDRAVAKLINQAFRNLEQVGNITSPTAATEKLLMAAEAPAPTPAPAKKAPPAKKPARRGRPRKAQAAAPVAQAAEAAPPKPKRRRGRPRKTQG